MKKIQSEFQTGIIIWFVQVRYPDQRVQVVTPQATAWKRLGQLRHRLVMQVLLAHGLWSGNARQFVLTKYWFVKS